MARALLLAAPTPLARIASSCRCTLHTTPALLWDDYDNQRHEQRSMSAYGRAWRAFTGPLRRFRRRFTEVGEDPYGRKGAVTGDVKSGRLGYARSRDGDRHDVWWPFETEVLIIGGGIVGASAAYWIKERNPEEDYHVTLVENPDTFSRSATVLSAGGIRQQFSIPESVQMSLFTAEFLRNAGEWLRIKNNDPPHIQFMPMPYLFLATTQKQADTIETNWKMQCTQGAKVALLSRDQLQARYPFMQFDDVIVGSMGLENEGAVDPWQLLQALREKCAELGVMVIKGTVDSFMFDEVDESREKLPDLQPVRVDPAKLPGTGMRRIHGAYIRPAKTDVSPRPIRFHTCINAAGPWAGEIARLAGIGVGDGLLRVPLPIERRKRYVYVVHCPEGPGLDMPFLIDPSGVWCRREGLGHTYLCGRSPTKEQDALIDHSNLDVDHDFFVEHVWPVLAARVPAFSALKVKNAWAGWYDYNWFDENAIIGTHPAYSNLFHIGGFSGHGLQHALAAGRGFAEKHFDLTYTTIQLHKFDFNRIIKNQPLEESGII